MKNVWVIAIFVQIFFEILQSQWKCTNGPPDGTMGKIIIHPTDPNIVYGIITSQPNTGVLKSTDSGETWEVLNNGLYLDTMETVERTTVDLALDISKPETLYVSIYPEPFTTTGALFKSTDGGNNWGKILDDHIKSMITDNDFIAASNDSGFIVSYDGGSNWELRNSDLKGMKILMDEEGAFWISGYKDLYCSEDTGKTYRIISFPNAFQIRCYDVVCSGANSLVTVGIKGNGQENDALYFSTDRGFTWINRTTSLPWDTLTDGYRIPTSIKISKLNSGNLFAGLIGGFYYSPDTGKSWTEQNTGLILPHALFPRYYWLYISTIEISRLDPNFIILGTMHDGIYRSRTGGLDWQWISTPTGRRTELALLTKSNKILGMSVSGIFTYDGEYWSPTSMLVGGLLGEISALSGGIYSDIIIFGLTGGLGEGYIYVSTDLGVNWDFRNPTPFGYYQKIMFDPIDSNQVYAMCQCGFFISTDNGTTWNASSILPGWYPIDIVIDPRNNNSIYILRKYGNIDKSTDKGETWQNIRSEVDSFCTVIRMDPEDSQTLYIGSDFLIKSTDAGSSWNKTSFNKKITDITFDNTTNDMFIGTKCDGVWKLVNSSNDCDVLDGISSKRITSLLFNVRNNRRYLYVGTGGIGAYEYYLGEVQIVRDVDTSTRFFLHQNYPNPFNPITTIKYQLPKASSVKLIVLNILGQIVVTLKDEVEPAGYHSLDLDASNLASGVYIYRIVADDFIQTKKMILIR